MISSHPAPARTSYVPALRLSPVGGATVTGMLFVSSSCANARLSAGIGGQPAGGVTAVRANAAPRERSEGRRVGKEWRSRWSPDHLKKKKIAEKMRITLTKYQTSSHN